MKKVISLVIVLCMCLSAVPAFSESTAEIVPREELFDRIEEVCKNAGCKVFRDNVSIGVIKGIKHFVVTDDTVTYMENKRIVKENLYVDDTYVKMPRKAIDIVLKEDFPKAEKAIDRYVFSKYFKDTVNGDYVYVDAVNKSVEDEDCIVEIKEVLIGTENTYVTAKITAKNEAGKAILPIWSDYSWMNFYGTAYGHMTINLNYTAESIIDTNARYFLYKIKTINIGTLKNLRVETRYNYEYDYLDIEIKDMDEEIKTDFDGGYVLLKPLRIEYHLTDPKGTDAEKENTPDIVIKLKDGSEKFIEELCTNKVSKTKDSNGAVLYYVNYFKEVLDLESVEKVLVNESKRVMMR